jgi:uncharacterized protein YraI
MGMRSGHRSPVTAALALMVAGALTALGACSASSDPVDSEDLTAAPEDSDFAITQEVATGTTLRATANVNLRSGPSTSNSVLRVVPKGSLVKVVDSVPNNAFYKIDHNGTVGWGHGQYYEIVDDGGVDGSTPAGTSLQTTGDVNLRSGPGTSYAILDVLTKGTVVTVVDPTPQNNFYKVDHQGTVGWSSGNYLEAPGGGGGDPGGGSTVRDQAITRAKAGMGFSYWWGHGRFKPEGATASTKGSCSGGCPSCTHSGSYGGDCSGFVAKVWQVPSTNTDLTVDSHPYSTASFNSDTSQWTTVSRGSVKKGDAMVYRSGGAGHIFIYSSGDGWGTMYTYECKACAAGCVYGSRTAGSSYHAIKKVGW